MFLYFSWHQYLEFLEKIYPTKTGLRIPPSKMPAEFVKHYPEPSNDWPSMPNRAPRPDMPHVMSPPQQPNMTALTSTNPMVPGLNLAAQGHMVEESKPIEMHSGRLEKVHVSRILISKLSKIIDGVLVCIKFPLTKTL